MRRGDVMSHLVQARPVNGPFGDPGLYVDVRYGRRALLFDLPDLSPLSPRELLRVTDVVVTHRHMDHFAGFDQLLRLHLHRNGRLRLVGPEGMTGAVWARLHSYSWNLLGSHSADFILEVADLAGDTLSPGTAFRARAAFVPEPLVHTPLPLGLVLDEDDVRLEVATLDHGIPCLAVALQETLRVHVDPTGLARLGLPIGRWLNAAKTALRRGDPDDVMVAVGEQMVPLGLLRREAFRTAPGQRLVYVTDAAPTEANARAIVALARGADQLFIEAAFLHEDFALAQQRRHLTAHGAGILARDAGVRQLVVHHHSPRYIDRPHALRQEAEAAFAGGLTQVVP